MGDSRGQWEFGVQAIRISIGSLLLAAVCLPAATASAQGLGSGVRFGTSGIGLALESYFVTEHFGIRGLVDGGSTYDYNQGRALDGEKFRFGTGVLLADWHPYASGFRLSGGLVYNNERLSGVTRSSGGAFSMNRLAYSSVGLLDGRMAVSRATPYLGVGWGLTPRTGSRLYFSADLGVMYQRPSAMLTAGCGSALSAGLCTQLHNEEVEFREGADDLRLYPVISVGFGLRF
jgi:hypothetical protein